MAVTELSRALAGHRLLLLDTMVLSYHIAAHPRYVPLTTLLLGMIESGQVSGLITTVTMAEVLTRPAQADDRQAMLSYELYLTGFPNLDLVPPDLALARETAWVRATTALRTPDAVQVAAARLFGADAIVGNDRRWLGRVHGPTLIMLDDYVESA